MAEITNSGTYVPLAAASLNTMGSIAGAYVSNEGNRKSQKRANQYNTEMYNRQRADAIADRDLQRSQSLADWAMENEYNSPKAQMQRYRDAQLNPNLIYGEGVSASSGQSNQMHETSTRSSQQGNSQAARYNMDFGMQNFVQTLLLEKQAKVLDSQAEKNYAEAGLSGANEEKIRTLLPLEKDGKTVDIEMARKNIDRISSEILNNSKDIDLKTQQIIESDARVKKLYNDVVLSRLELENEINRTNIQRGQLSAHNRDISNREQQTSINRAQLDFEKKSRAFSDAMKKAGVQTDQFGNPFKAIGTVVPRFLRNQFKGLSDPADTKIPNYE